LGGVKIGVGKRVQANSSHQGMTLISSGVMSCGEYNEDCTREKGGEKKVKIGGTGGW